MTVDQTQGGDADHRPQDSTPSRVHSSAAGPLPSPARILHLVKGLDEGGAEHLLVLAARHRDRERFVYEVAHLLPHHVALRDALHREHVATTCLAGTPWWDPRWLVRLRRRLRIDPVDLVHAHSPLVATGARVVLLTMRRSDRPRMVVTLHNMWASHHRAVRILDHLTHRLDDARLTVSEAVRRSLPGGAGGRAVTQIHGIDVAQLRAEADRDAVRDELGVTGGEILVGTVANLRSNKGYPDLLAAAQIVTQARPGVRFVSVGQGPLLAELEGRRDAAGLGERFRFLGHRPGAARLVSGFDVFCLASLHEGLPLALMEALVLGVPVVVTDVGGIGELVTHGREGLLVPAGDPAALAAAILELVRDPVRRDAHGAAAWRAGSGLDAAIAAAAVEAHYDRVLGR